MKPISKLKNLIPDPLSKQKPLLQKIEKALQTLGIRNAKPLFIKQRVLHLEVTNPYVAQIVHQKKEELISLFYTEIKRIQCRQKNGS